MKRLILALICLILHINRLVNDNTTVHSNVLSIKPFIKNTVNTNTIEHLASPLAKPLIYEEYDVDIQLSIPINPFSNSSKIQYMKMSSESTLRTKSNRTNYSANTNENDLNVSSIGTFYNMTANVNGTDVVFRVVNGKKAKLGEVPYLVAIMQKKHEKLKKDQLHLYFAYCGGAIIGPSTVLTAAHCVEVQERENPPACSKGKIYVDDMKDKAVVAGYLKAEGVRRLLENKEGQWRRIKSGAFPIEYNFPRHDIAIVLMNHPFQFNDHVDSIPWSIDALDYNGLFCRTAGYGLLGDNILSENLVVADLQVLSARSCTKLHQNKNMDKFICTSDMLSDVHQGDSGGPLVCKGTGDTQEDPKKGVTVGVVSGKTIGVPLSTFFTRVSAYKSFINKHKSSQLIIPNQVLASVCLISIWLLF